MIEIINLTKVYSKGSEPAIEHVSLSVKDGEILGFAGLNGAGKTTTIRIASGLIYPTRGTVRIDGKDIVKEKALASFTLGMVPEFPNFELNAKPISLLVYYSGFFNIGNEDAHKRAINLMELVGLSGETDKKLRDYSQGMKKRFSLAASMMHRPHNYLFDELLNGMDPEGIRLIRKIAADLKSEGSAVLLSTHILSELGNLADRVAIIHKGHVMTTVDKEELSGLPGKNLEERFFKIIGE